MFGDSQKIELQKCTYEMATRKQQKSKKGRPQDLAYDVLRRLTKNRQ